MAKSMDRVNGISDRRFIIHATGSAIVHDWNA